MEVYLQHGNSSNATDSTANPDTLSNLYPAFIRVFVVIILGYVTGRLGLVSPTEAKGISRLAVYAALPAFIFRKIATVDFSKLKWMLVLVVTMSKCIIFLGVTLMTLLFTRDIGRAGVFGVFCTFSNDLALGSPIFIALYEEKHKEFMYCVYFLFVLNVTLYLPVGLLMMDFHHQRSKDPAARLSRTVLKSIKSVLRTPVVVAAMIGAVANQVFQQNVPKALDAPLLALSNAFGAAALFYLGLSVVGKIKAKVGMIILVPLSLSVTKVIILPLIIRALCTSFNIGGDDGTQEDWSSFGFLYGTVPPGLVIVMYAAAFDIEKDLTAFGLVMATLLSAPVMFSSSQMVSVRNMISTSTKYRDLLSATRSDCSFVAIVLACWVIMMLFLSRRYKTTPHNYTICLVLSQLLLCISFVLTKSDSFISSCKELGAFLLAAFLFASHCWTTILAFTLVSLRCPLRQQPKFKKLLIYAIGWGLPALCSGIAVLILKSDMQNYSFSEKDFFYFIIEKKAFLGFWIAVLLVSIVVCVGCLIRLHRCDQYGKGEVMEKQDCQPDENTPLIPKHDREEYHRRAKSGNCANEVENAEQLCSSSKSFKPEHSKHTKETTMLDLSRYYEGKQHEIGKHFVIIVSQILLMIVCLFYSVWILVGDGKTSGIFLEIQLFVSVILSTQVIVPFACFGFERAILLDPLLQRARRYWYGVDEVILPNVSDLTTDEYRICEQFVHYHKESCAHALFSKETLESSLDSSIKVNSCPYYFSGNKLVDWLLEVGLVADRITAVHYGNSLLRGRVIRHFQNRYYFRDANLAYEFCADWDNKGIGDAN